jgi:hypothetical protein
MSLTELADLFGNMGAAVRTGPISGHQSCPKCRAAAKSSVCPRCKKTPCVCTRRSNVGCPSCQRKASPRCPRCQTSPCSCPRRTACPHCNTYPCSCHRRRSAEACTRCNNSPCSCKKRECSHCGVPVRSGRPCNCKQSPVISHIRTINKSPAHTRDKSLMDLLKFQTAVLGLIVSQQTKKCIGAIDHSGTIKHCDAKEAIGPYNIIVKPTTKDSIQSRRPNERVLGQCVDPKGNTIAELVRKNQQNRISLARTSRAPIMAVVIPSALKEESPTLRTLDALVRESKAMISK